MRRLSLTFSLCLFIALLTSVWMSQPSGAQESTPTSGTALQRPTVLATGLPPVLPTSTASLTPSQTPSLTITPSPTDSPTRTATNPATATATRTANPTTPPPTLTATATRAALTATSAITATDTASPSPTASATQSPTATASETASPTATETLTATPTDTPSITPTLTETPEPISVSNRPTAETEVSSDDGGFNPLIGVGLFIMAMIGGYAVVFALSSAALDRYAAGFVLTRCPVCETGQLEVEERPYRAFGIPRLRRTVRCNQCRSVLREVGRRRWRYAVDPNANPTLFEAANGKVFSEAELSALAPGGGSERPSYVEGD